ncbi:LysM peptidoglycan-binding domain-containing protein [Tropicibacter oceani]|uniref:LysM peptidoglycan-binding domain-containing protein n=1 Tax=Tropicibacter oceani TaxID=3058420 RepID=A0ABY8QCS2_9RHOB|nr:LysM peptidoglycan-binding domain-containing protein [Tropicibacter oceani]WGW02429.1 LysM peptidoglycan-binding domain-containing protein [Tropicibacter oceani]
MSKLAQNAAIGGMATAAVALGLVVTGVIDLGKALGRDPAPEPAALMAPDGDSPVQPAAPAARGASLTAAAPPPAAAEPAAAAAPAPQQAAPQPQAEAQTEPAQPDDIAPPSFDLVRAEPGGSTLVAGIGTPGAQVQVLVDGTAAADAEVGADGRFVAFVDIAAGANAHVVTLLQKQGDQIRASDEEVIITPTAIPAEPDQLASASAPQPQPAADPSPGDAGNPAPQADAPQTPAGPGAPPETATTPSPGAAQTPPDVTTQLAAAAPQEQAAPNAAGAMTAPVIAAPPAALATAAAPQAPSVLLSSPRGIEVLQTAPLAPGDVALDAISYDAEGEVLLSGRGEETAFVRVYLDNSPVTTSRIREDGRWRITLPQVDTGTYTLRVDQLTEAGVVTARVESPFLRESPEVLQAATTQGPITAITVQPGNTLWAIARDRYGEGLDYLKVYQANKDRIRNPDLIYPGQIFDLPDQ